MDVDSQEQSAERAELHFLAALYDELMKELLESGTLARAQVQKIEDAVSQRLGSPPRAW